MTDEQRKAKAKEWHANRTPEQRASKAAKAKEWRANLTPEQRASKAAKAKEWYANRTPEQKNVKAEKVREQVLKKKYNITPKQFYQMYNNQNGSCFFCKNELIVKDCHIDHDHETGRVRCLLCSSCNRGFGCFYENSDALESAAKAAIEFKKPDFSPF